MVCRMLGSLTVFCSVHRFCLFASVICVPLAEMDSSFDADGPDDDLSTAFGTETLAERAMIPEGFANTPSSRTNIPVEVVCGYGRATLKEISTLKAFNLIVWWNDNKTVYRTLCL
jgi:hypothetical protein